MKDNDYAIYGLICFAIGLFIFGLPLSITCSVLGVINIVRHDEKGTALGVIDIVLGLIGIALWMMVVAR